MTTDPGSGALALERARGADLFSSEDSGAGVTFLPAGAAVLLLGRSLQRDFEWWCLCHDKVGLIRLSEVNIR